jgi:hypothetical protein
MAYLSLLNHHRLYAIQPRNACFGPPVPPWHVTPPPYSHPEIAGEGERHLIQARHSLRLVIVSELDAVIGVDA